MAVSRATGVEPGAQMVTVPGSLQLRIVRSPDREKHLPHLV